MVSVLFLLASAAMANAPVAQSAQSVRSSNGEFVFSQYPERALKAGEQGSVRFRAEVDEKGSVTGCKVTEGSGYRRLDAETCTLIANHATFGAALDGNGKARRAVHDGVVNWRIPGAPPAERKVTVAGRSMDEVVCRRTPRTGSLVATSRLCMTRREWTRSAERNQNEWGELQGIRGSSREDQPTFTGGSPP